MRKLPDRPFVAHLSRTNEVEVIERDGGIICRSIPGTVYFRQVIVFLIGAGLSAAVWYCVKQPARANTPMVWVVLMAVLAVACWLAFVRYSFGTPRFEVSGVNGDLSLFRRRTTSPWKTITRDEITHFRLEVQPFIDESDTVDNLVVFVYTTSGVRRALAGSPDQALIRALAARLGQITRHETIEGSWSGK